jgi:hypothetical protein
MIKYKFEQFDEPIECEYWNLKNITLNVDYFNAEIILTDVNGLNFSHTFQDVNYVFSKTWQDCIDECEMLISEHAI